jgi:uncharacterized membrane protein YgcG
MNMRKLKTAWFVALPALSVMGYAWPTVGAFATIALILLTALANSLLELKSAALGRHVALMSALTTLASCLGAYATKTELLVLTFAATVFGYLFAAVPVRLASKVDRSDETRGKFESGGGGDFGGGGAGGNF